MPTYSASMISRARERSISLVWAMIDIEGDGWLAPVSLAGVIYSRDQISFVENGRRLWSPEGGRWRWKRFRGHQASGLRVHQNSHGRCHPLAPVPRLWFTW